MTTLIIKDNTTHDQTDFNQLPLLTNKIVDKTLSQLEQAGVFVLPETLGSSDDLEADQMVLQSNKQTYRSSNVMGFLGINDEQLTIQSRFATAKQDYFFQYLLEKTLDMPNITNFNTRLNPAERIFDLYTFLFPRYLKNAMRKGLFKTYVWRHYNNQNVKGIIDIKRHILLNTPFAGNVAFKQREFSFDNDMTQLIRHTIEFIKVKSFGKSVLQQVQDEISQIIAITSSYQYFDRQKVIANNQQNPIQHAYYQEYRDLQRLCLRILQHDKHNIGTGTNQINGILFDGAWLWETYIAQLIDDEFYHSKNKAGMGTQHLFSMENGNGIGHVYPDFISKNIENRIIADTKYKPMSNIGNKDYLQVLAYMFRFNAQAGYYIYPEQDHMAKLARKMFLNEGTTFDKNVMPRQDISVTKLGFQIPESQAISYSDFADRMRMSEVNLIKSLVKQPL